MVGVERASAICQTFEDVLAGSVDRLAMYLARLGIYAKTL
jgi:hypothetical protein